VRMRIRCPLLAFFGTNGDVGNTEDLEPQSNISPAVPVA
jgi:hypothetical protein